MLYNIRPEEKHPESYIVLESDIIIDETAFLTWKNAISSRNISIGRILYAPTDEQPTQIEHIIFIFLECYAKNDKAIKISNLFF